MNRDDLKIKSPVFDVLARIAKLERWKMDCEQCYSVADTPDTKELNRWRALFSSPEIAEKEFGRLKQDIAELRNAIKIVKEML